MRLAFVAALAAAVVAGGSGLAAPPAGLPAAIYTDPAPDAAHPARMATLHIPSGGVLINGVAYLASGAGPHPTVVLCHGLPGDPPRRLERGHLQLSRLVGQPGRLPLRPEP
jgi:hypothetical protein